MSENLYSPFHFTPHQAMQAAAQLMSMIGQPGVPVDPGDPRTVFANPAVGAALGNTTAYGAGPLMAGMGLIPAGGFSVTHIDVQPSSGKKKSSMTPEERFNMMSQRRDKAAAGRGARAAARQAQPLGAQQLPDYSNVA